jgi:hypothetical protein
VTYISLHNGTIKDGRCVSVELIHCGRWWFLCQAVLVYQLARHKPICRTLPGDNQPLLHFGVWMAQGSLLVVKQTCCPVPLAVSAMLFLLSPSRRFCSSFFADPLIDLISMLLYAVTYSYLFGSPTRWSPFLLPLTTVIGMYPVN